jgi:hypothetical protein
MIRISAKLKVLPSTLTPRSSLSRPTTTLLIRPTGNKFRINEIYSCIIAISSPHCPNILPIKNIPTMSLSLKEGFRVVDKLRMFQ